METTATATALRFAAGAVIPARPLQGAPVPNARAGAGFDRLAAEVAAVTRLPCLLALSLLLLAPPARAAESAFDFYARGPYRAAVPRPEAILGYPLGTVHTTFRDQERTLKAIAAAAPDRVKLIEYGRSVEGRPLRLALVTHPDNLARLEAIRADRARLADPRTLPEEEAQTLLKRTPVCLWLSHCIHGNETASFETALATLYTLAASERPEIVQALKDALVVLNPVYNPDGHERFVVYFNAVATGSAERFAIEQSEPWSIWGRVNHYRFDLNRDKLAQSQPESRAESAALLAWQPQVYADLHGQPEVYFFPPNALPTHPQVDRARLAKWTVVFGKENAAAFDRFGWNYVTRETFDFFYPGYLDSFATLSGAIGMTYETDGGGSLARRRADGTVVTLRDAAAHHFEASLATIRAGASHRSELLADWFAFRRDACRDTGPVRRVVIPPGPDRVRRAALAATLLRAGIEVRETEAAFTAERAAPYGGAPEKKTFPAGSLVVEYAQPQGRAARAFLEPEAREEPAFVAEQLARRARNEKRNENEPREGYEFYDVTGWSLPYAFDLPAWQVEETPAPAGRKLALEADGGAPALSGPPGGIDRRARVAYLFPFDSEAAGILALRLQQEGFRLMAATRPLPLAGRTWPRGTLIARVERNAPALHTRIEALARQFGVRVTATDRNGGDADSPGLGSESVIPLRRPRIALAAGDGVSVSDMGLLWWWLEKELGAQFTLVSPGALRGQALAAFDALLLPEGWGYAGAFGKEGVEELKAWMRRGGTVIGIEGGGTWLAAREFGLTSIARVDEEPPKKDEKEPVKPRRPTPVPGAIVRARLDREHFLGWGYERDEIALPLDGDRFWKPSEKGSNVALFPKEGPLRLSGFVWPDNTEPLLAGGAAVVDEPIGAGHLIVFCHHPMPRAFWQGTRRMLLAAILFGPGGSEP